MPATSIRVAYKRKANMKELLAPSNPYSPLVRNLSSATSKEYSATSKDFKIDKSLTCTSANIVYLLQCVSCDLQSVGSSVDFKKRLANYKSHIKRINVELVGLLTVF